MRTFSLIDLVRSEQAERLRHVARARERRAASPTTTYLPFIPPDRRLF